MPLYLKSILPNKGIMYFQVEWPHSLLQYTLYEHTNSIFLFLQEIWCANNDWIFIEFPYPIVDDAFCVDIKAKSGVEQSWTFDVYASPIECEYSMLHISCQYILTDRFLLHERSNN